MEVNKSFEKSLLDSWGGVEILIPPIFYVHYSVQILSFYLRIWMEVNKSFKTFIWKTFLKIPCVFLVTAKQFTN